MFELRNYHYHDGTVELQYRTKEVAFAKDASGALCDVIMSEWSKWSPVPNVDTDEKYENQ